MFSEFIAMWRKSCQSTGNVAIFQFFECNTDALLNAIASRKLVTYQIKHKALFDKSFLT